jgi:hypothetical protein
MYFVLFLLYLHLLFTRLNGRMATISTTNGHLSKDDNIETCQTVSSLGQLLSLLPMAVPAILQTTNADERAQTVETVL